MYKKVLVPLDGSKRAELILPHAEGLARCNQAEIILLQVYQVDFAYYGQDPEVFDSLREDCKKQVLAYLAEVQQKHFGSRFQVRILAEEGPVIETIMSVAQREDVDLIAMGSHGRTGLSRVFYGSVAMGVLNQVDRPLLIVRSMEHKKTK
jgi:nucleotide-binding universal stress UspA family protein